MDVNITTIFLLAFSTGILHALDADHVMAVTGIASKKFNIKEIIQLCARWSMGHGLTLLLLGSALYLFGISLAEEYSAIAETIVAVFLILIGLWIFYDLKRSHAHLHFHHHDGLKKHAHWHVHNKSNNENDYTQKNHSDNPHLHKHSAVLIGIVHGVAGIAPLLAIIPLSNEAAWVGVGYLVIFCLGVLISMIIFGGVLGKSLDLIQRKGSISINSIRSVVAISSISLGIYWL